MVFSQNIFLPDFYNLIRQYQGVDTKKHYIGCPCIGLYKQMRSKTLTRSLSWSVKKCQFWYFWCMTMHYSYTNRHRFRPDNQRYMHSWNHLWHLYRLHERMANLSIHWYPLLHKINIFNFLLLHLNILIFFFFRLFFTKHCYTYWT